MKILAIALIAAVVGVLSLPAGQEKPPPFDAPETVSVAAGGVDWRPLGSFALDGKERTPPAVRLEVPAFEIMTFQVSRAQYAACVADGGCAAVPMAQGKGPLPQTQVNWNDATAFARWYSNRTGEIWRLPTEPEWQRAAAERYGDTAAGPDALDPGQRMLESYRKGVLLRGTLAAALRPAGGFGTNSLGIADIAGNVWEWTDGCVQNGTLDSSGAVIASDPYCWVRVAGGPHRAAVVDFVRDASVGGCTVGLPPDHLGFRLVRGR